MSNQAKKFTPRGTDTQEPRAIRPITHGNGVDSTVGTEGFKSRSVNVLSSIARSNQAMKFSPHTIDRPMPPWLRTCKEHP